MKTICVMRDVFKAMARFEDAFEKVYQVSLNEAMILCALQEASPNNMTATSLSKRTELTPSHASKMLRILEEKELIVRTLGEEDGLQKNKTVNRLFIYYRLFTVSRFVILQATL